MIGFISQKYCSGDLSLVENYAKAFEDSQQVWACHHRAELLPCGQFDVDALKRYGLYWNRPASELIFLEPGAHTRLHNSVRKYTAETRRKMSIAATGKHHTAETCDKISRGNKGKIISEATRQKLRTAMKKRPPAMLGKHHSEQTKLKIGAANSRGVIQISCLTGEVIRRWNSATEAAAGLFCTSSAISQACRGRRKTALGYIWKYEEK